MKKTTISLTAALFGLRGIFSAKSYAQSQEESGFNIEIDPIAYGLNGFSIHGGYLTGPRCSSSRGQKAFVTPFFRVSTY